MHCVPRVRVCQFGRQQVSMEFQNLLSMTALVDGYSLGLIVISIKRRRKKLLGGLRGVPQLGMLRV